MNTLKLTKCPDEAPARIIGLPHGLVGAIGPDRTCKLQVLVVDGRQQARAQWRELLGRCEVPGGVVAGVAADAARAMALVQGQRFDLALVHADLPGAGGFVLARTLARLARPVAVVLVSDHPGHAAQAFDADAADFLTMPVRPERLQQALRKAHRLLDAAANGAGADILLIPQRDQLLQLPLHEVVYFKAETKYITVRTVRHSHLMAGSLADLQARYGSWFLRVHRNALVARRCLRALERVPDSPCGHDRWQLRLEEVDEVLAVSRRLLPAVRAAFRHGA